MERAPEIRWDRGRNIDSGMERLLSPEGLREYLSDPLNSQEMIHYMEYLREIRDFVRAVPPPQQPAARYYIDRSILPVPTPLPIQDAEQEVLQLEVTEPTPPPLPRVRSIAVGEHMTVSLGQVAADCWPDKGRSLLRLSDGAVVVRQTPVGIIDYYRNMGQLTEEESVIGFARTLIGSAKESLNELAGVCVQNAGHQDLPEAFNGMSHLARLAHRFGFTTFDIADDYRRGAATQDSLNIARSVGQNNKEWNLLKQNYKPAKVAIISEPELVRRYEEPS